ncbi:DUF2993 domain-containing protein [Mycobacterium sp. B14F4]|uniref:LmeA family phospholipid-binding protein n=1 Tax=Mycobacterium sp. B14F4 TaxID=3153565 RepID=UPI00325C5058
MTDPWARPNQPPPTQAPQPGYPGQQAGPPGTQAGPPPQSAPPAPPERPSSGSKLANLFRDPLSIVLVVVIVMALALAGVLGGELYARSRADSIVARSVSCVVQDEAKASFGVMPPFLIQHMSGHYTNIHIETAGNQIREAKGMKVDIFVEDVRLEDTADSSGTIGSLVADISWTTEGISQTVSDSIPLVGAFVSGVSTNPSDGTVELEGPLGSITAQPTVVDGGISLQVTELTGLGFSLPRETVQPALDAFTSQLTNGFPMGIKADSVEVTDTGVQSRFSAQNAEIPKGQQDACFAGL